MSCVMRHTICAGSANVLEGMLTRFARYLLHALQSIRCITVRTGRYCSQLTLACADECAIQVCSVQTTTAHLARGTHFTMQCASLLSQLLEIVTCTSPVVLDGGAKSEKAPAAPVTMDSFASSTASSPLATATATSASAPPPHLRPPPPSPPLTLANVTALPEQHDSSTGHDIPVSSLSPALPSLHITMLFLSVCLHFAGLPPLLPPSRLPSSLDQNAITGRYVDMNPSPTICDASISIFLCAGDELSEIRRAASRMLARIMLFRLSRAWCPVGVKGRARFVRRPLCMSLSPFSAALCRLSAAATAAARYHPLRAVLLFDVTVSVSRSWRGARMRRRLAD